jgi:hypothetical protein
MILGRCASASRWIAGASLVLLAVGCAGKTSLLPPGASGPIVFHVWGDPGEQPTVILTDTLIQEGNYFDHLIMNPVIIRHPFQDGLVYIQAPRGDYDANGPDTIVFTGPVRLSGTLQGEPMIGLAAKAVMRRVDQRMELTQVELLSHGSIATTQRMFIDRAGRADTRPYRFEKVPGPAAVSAALAALPHPMVFPEIKEGDR